MVTAILGLGKVGLSLARYFYGNDEEVWGIDDNKNLAQINPAIRDCSTKLFLGGELPPMAPISRFFISPGIDPRHPAAQAARKQGLDLEGELDLAFSLGRGDVIAVTGTNGKSTTVSLLGAIYSAAGFKTGVGGNLGTPYLDLVLDPQGFEKFIVEVSSYQLETIRKFRPKVAALINISADHLDRYAGMREYVAAKARIFEFQKPEDFAVFNDDDLHVLEAVQPARSRHVPVSISKRVSGAYAESDRLVWAPHGEIESSFPLKDCKLRGLHNLENMSVALACAKVDGIEDAAIQKALDTFKGLAHRVEWVARIGNVDYYDDSKGTNVGAVVMSLAGFDKDVVLILGGRDKGGDYAPLKPLIRHKAKAVIVLGEAKEKILQELQGSSELLSVDTLQEAVREAHRLAPPGGTVLLSPACSSFDMFKDYHDRGEQFKKAVRQLR